ncbi:MAG: hypothetical protein R3296_06210 [Oleiphilaceae bacterium]|nr:hypothetical protein [Oleiphilaceae bacterium]
MPGAGLCQSLGVQFQHWQPAELRGSPGERVPRQQFQLQWQPDRNTRLLYRYEPIRLRAGEPAHNGHLHQFRAGIDGTWRDLQFSGVAGIHGSSNRFVYQRFHQDMLVVEGVVFHRLPEQWLPDLGVAADHRFGPFRIYPRLRWQGEWMDWDWRFDLPVEASLTEESWQLELARVGHRWSVLDRDRRLDSKVYRYEWQLSADYRLRDPRQAGPGVTLGVGSSFATRLRYRDLAQGQKTRQLSSAVFVRLRISGGSGS